jgi:iodotyrosine deiodinase
LRNASIYKLKKPLMIIATGHAAEGAKVPAVAKIKKPLDEILTVIE